MSSENISEVYPYPEGWRCTVLAVRGAASNQVASWMTNGTRGSFLQATGDYQAVSYIRQLGRD
jgi:hypothetical protein